MWLAWARSGGWLMNESDRGPLLTAFAVLFGILALSDLAKPIEAGLGGDLRPGFVFFGHRLSGTANAVVGPLFGLYLLLYAAGIWRMRRWALPMGTRSEEHTSELQSPCNLVCRLLLEKKKKNKHRTRDERMIIGML